MAQERLEGALPAAARPLPAASPPLPAASLHPGDGTVLSCRNWSPLPTPHGASRRPVPPASSQALRECPVGVRRGRGRDQRQGVGLWPRGGGGPGRLSRHWGWGLAGLRALGLTCTVHLCDSVGSTRLFRKCPRGQRYLNCKLRNCLGEPRNSWRGKQC